MEATKASVDVENDGTVVISSPDGQSLKLAQDRIDSLTRDAEVGGVYTGKVSRITSFGAFVEILPGKDGLVRIPELSDRAIDRVEDEVQVGDEVTVMVIEIDQMGRINLSRRAVLQNLTLEDVKSSQQRSNQDSSSQTGGSPFRPSGPRSGNRRPDFRPGFQRRPGNGPPGDRR